LNPPTNDPRGDATESGDKAAAKESIPNIERDVARTREEFAATLNAIEDKVNPRSQFRRARAAVKKRLDDDPTPLVAGAAAGVAGAVAIVAGIARLASRGR
jgi:hypothetical protein